MYHAVVVVVVAVEAGVDNKNLGERVCIGYVYTRGCNLNFDEGRVLDFDPVHETGGFQ